MPNLINFLGGRDWMSGDHGERDGRVSTCLGGAQRRHIQAAGCDVVATDGGRRQEARLGALRGEAGIRPPEPVEEIGAVRPTDNALAELLVLVHVGPVAHVGQVAAHHVGLLHFLRDLNSKNCKRVKFRDTKTSQNPSLETNSTRL